MTIAEQTPINRHVADGINDRFVFTFTALDNLDITVILNGVEQTEGIDYNLENITPLGGDVVFIDPPFLNSAVVIYRLTTRSQEVVYNPFDPFPAKTHEGALDKLTVLVQESFARAQFGLPLDVGGLFWDANGFRIQNLAEPIDPDHAATKRYVDLTRGDAAPDIPWDPDEDWVTTGNWFNHGNWLFDGGLEFNGFTVATINQIPDVTGKADKSITLDSDDIEVLTIANPTLADDITFSIRSNVGSGLVKLNTAGKIPPELLDFSGLEFLGGWDPDDGLPLDGTPGQFYIILVDGSMTLLDRDGLPQITPVSVNDRILWASSPAAGWYYIANNASAVVASTVLYDNTIAPPDRVLDAEDVQLAIDEILVKFGRIDIAESIAQIWNWTGDRPQHQGVDLATVDDTPDLSEFTQRDVNEAISGQWSFGVGINLVGSQWPAGVGNNGQVLTTNGSGQLLWTEIIGGGGMDPTQDYFISGDWEWLSPLRLDQGVALTGRDSVGGGNLRQLARIFGEQVIIGDANAGSDIRFDSPGNPIWWNNIEFQLLATQNYVDDEIAGVQPPDLSTYTQRTVAETIAAQWTFDLEIQGITSGNLVASDLPDLGPYTQRGIGESISGTWAFNNGFTYEGNVPNTAEGLVQLNSVGKIQLNLLPIGGLDFQGTWDASSGNNPPNGTVGGEYYVINVGGTLTIFIDDSGIAVPTLVSPGDDLIWLTTASGNVAGWYYVSREAPVFVDASNVTYDPSGAPWTDGLVQEVLDEIGSLAALKDRVQTIAAVWTFSQTIQGTTSGNLVAGSLAPYTQRAVAETITAAWNYTGGLNINGAAAITAAALGPYTQRAQPETISGLWNYTVRPTFNAIGLATLNDIPPATDLGPYTQRLAAEAITGAWTFNGKKAGYRGANVITHGAANRILDQGDEEAYLRNNVVCTYSIAAGLDIDTTFIIATRLAAASLSNTGITLFYMDGDGGINASLIDIGIGSVVTVVAVGTNSYEVYGNGITATPV